MTAHALPFREAVAAYQREVGATAPLFRAIMAHPAWRVAGERGADGLRLAVLNPDGRGRILEAFSDAEAVATFEATAEGPIRRERVELAGYELFAALDVGTVDKIRLDPLSPHGLSYVADRLPLLAAWARIVRVELALYAPDRVADPLGELARFDGYHLVHVEGHEEALVLAPDAGGRNLAALFTAVDTAEAFAATMAVDTGERLAIRGVEGSRIFAELDGTGLDGVVFNPLSALPARALSAAVLPALVERTV